MADIQHRSLTGASLHDNKGVSTAADHEVATAISGVTDWKKLTHENLTGSGNPFGGQLAHFVYELNQGDDGGTFTSGDWETRILNKTLTNEITSCTLGTSTGKITLPAGTYHCEAYAVGNQCGKHKLRLHNQTNDTLLITGLSAISDSDPTNAVLRGRFVITGTKHVVLQHRCKTTKTDDGLGASTNISGSKEIFAEILIWKVA